MVRWALPLSVTGALAFYAATAFAADFDEVMESVVRIGGSTWTALLTLSLLNYGLRFGRWHVYLRRFGQRVPTGRHFAVYVAGFALTPTPGKVGEGIRALYLKPFGINFGKSISALYAERVLDIVAVSILAALLYFAPISGFRWLAVVGALIAITLIAAQHPAILSGRETLLPYRWFRSLAAHVTTFQHNVTSLVRGRLLLLGLMLGVVAWGAEGAGLYLVAEALGVQMTPWTAIGIYATAMLAGAISFVPGGIGGAEATMAALLMIIGAPVSVAVASTVVVRVATLWFAVALGAAAMYALEARRTPVPVEEPGQDRN